MKKIVAGLIISSLLSTTGWTAAFQRGPVAPARAIPSLSLPAAAIAPAMSGLAARAPMASATGSLGILQATQPSLMILNSQGASAPAEPARALLNGVFEGTGQSSSDFDFSGTGDRGQGGHPGKEREALDILARRFQPGDEIQEFAPIMQELGVSRESFKTILSGLIDQGALVSLDMGPGDKGLALYTVPGIASGRDARLGNGYLKEGVLKLSSADTANHFLALDRIYLAISSYKHAEGVESDILRKNKRLAEVLKGNAVLILFQDILSAWSSHLRGVPQQEKMSNAVQALLKNFSSDAYYSLSHTPDLIPAHLQEFLPVLLDEYPSIAGPEAQSAIPSRILNRLKAEIEVLKAPVISNVRSESGKGTQEPSASSGAQGAGRKIPASLQAQIKGTTLETLLEQILTAGMNQEAEEKAFQDFKQMAGMNAENADAQKIKNWLEFLVSLPWTAETKDVLDVAHAATVLDEDHDGLEKAKDVILDYLAAKAQGADLKGQILLLVGPPGTGKTSLAQSIARAMGRKTTALRLGGVRDESVIRGHGRTYVGAVAGKILDTIRRVGTRNPVFVLDEIDKIGREGSNGDPTAALLEVLDPEQNSAFRDRYADVPFDLSKVFFVATANSLETIPEALKDRMEIVNFPGYTTKQKVEIATIHLIPKQVAAHKLDPKSVQFLPAALEHVIRRYTREGGVRQLERLIRNILRKIIRYKAGAEPIDPARVEAYLGLPKIPESRLPQNGVGLATALAVSSDIGEGSTLSLQVVSPKGEGKIDSPEQFGPMFRDAVKNAIYYLRTRAGAYGIDPAAFEQRDWYVTVAPAGHKDGLDGPSAGVTLWTALASEATGRPVKKGVAMTGEVDVKGNVFPIGGLVAKILAAHRNGYTMVLFPKSNEADLSELPDEIRSQIQLEAVSNIDEVLELALEPKAA